MVSQHAAAWKQQGELSESQYLTGAYLQTAAFVHRSTCRGSCQLDLQLIQRIEPPPGRIVDEARGGVYVQDLYPGGDEPQAGLGLRSIHLEGRAVQPLQVCAEAYQQDVWPHCLQTRALEIIVAGYP